MLQAGLWLFALGIAVHQARTLLGGAVLDVGALRAPISALLPAQIDQARSLLQRGLPAWAAQVGLLTLAQHQDGPRDAAEPDDRLAELRQSSMRGLGALMTLGRIAPPLAFLGVILELTSAISAPDAAGAGLPAQAALGHAVTSVCLGAMTALFSFSVARGLAAHVRALHRGSMRLRILIDESLGDTDGA